MAGSIALKYSGGKLNKTGIGSIGGKKSDTSITSAGMENIFDNVNRVEAINNRTEFRAVYVENTGDETIKNVILKLRSQPDNTEFEVAVEAGDEAQIITSEDQAPNDIVFYKLSDYQAFQLPIGVIEPDGYKIIWFKRTVMSNSPPESVFKITFNWTDFTNTLSNTINDVVSTSESVTIIEIESPSRLGVFTMGQGVMG